MVTIRYFSAASAFIHLKYLAPPPKLKKITIHVSTILALVLWDVNATGGYPIIDFTAEYRLADSFGEWKPISPNHISPTAVRFGL